jgi:hypothetical protein
MIFSRTPSGDRRDPRIVRSFYDGIRAFKGYMRRAHPFTHPYDWADLNPRERSRYAAREQAKRERRADKNRQR